MIKRISQTFIAGVLTILPIVITIALIMWMVSMFEAIFGHFLHLVLPRTWYHFGMGLLLGLVFIFVVGLLVQWVLGKKLFYWFEVLVLKIPIVKEIYHPIKQLQGMLVKSDKPKQGRAVMVTVKEGVEMIGIVMNEAPEKQLKRGKGKIAVLLPWSYQMGGFTIFVEPSAVEPLNISVEKAFKLAITAGIQLNLKKDDMP